MTPVQQSLTRLRRELETLARADDSDRLRGMLAGADLPALGNDFRPADLILKALEIPQFDANLALRLARTLAPVVDQETEALGRAGGYRAPAYWLNNLFSLAAGLPRESALFQALHGFFEAGHRATGLVGDAPYQLRRALCNQQTDGRLHEYWLSLLEPRPGPWDGGRRSELMEAWRGLLWLADPSPQADWLAPLSRALLRLHETVKDCLQGPALLRHALVRLERAFPTSVGSRGLMDAIRPHWREWPELLQDAALALWPALAPRPLDRMPHCRRT